MEPEDIQTESHPWEPFIPDGAKILIMGTFPPGNHRWSMDFYYPNRTNDFWFMMGLIFLNDKNALYDSTLKKFNEPAIRALLTDKHIAMHDTARTVRRLKGNASDKYLEIIEPVQLDRLLGQMPLCHTVASTGEKAASVIARLTDTDIPALGTMVTGHDGLEIWRMPSTSRAYPLPLAQKADHYTRMFRHTGII